MGLHFHPHDTDGHRDAVSELIAPQGTSVSIVGERIRRNQIS